MKPITKLFLIIFFILLPWQTRWIFGELTLGGDPWEYGKLALYASEIVLLAIIFFQRRIKVTRYAMYAVVAAVVLFISAIASFVLSDNRELSFFTLVHLAEALTLFVILLHRHLPYLLMIRSFVAGMIIPSVLGWLQVIGQEVVANKWFGLAAQLPVELGASVVEYDGERLLRAYGTFSHPNIFGGFLVIALIAVLFLWLRRRGVLEKWLLLGLVILFSSTLLITFSRSAWLALVASLVVVFFFFVIARAWKMSRRALGVVGLMVVTFLIIAGAFWQPFVTRLDADTRLEEQSIAERQGQYTEFVGVYQSSPAIGVGLGAYTVALEAQDPGQGVWQYQPVHNSILLVLAELGIVGAIFFVLLVQVLDWRNYRAWRSLEGVFGMTLGTGVLVVSLLDHYTWSSWSGLILSAFVLAMIYQFAEAGLRKRRRKLV